MNKTFEEISKRIPLHTKIMNHLIYADYNWDTTVRDDDGGCKFLGKMEVVNEEAADIMEMVLKWVDNGMPGIEDTKEYIKKLRNNEIDLNEED